MSKRFKSGGVRQVLRSGGAWGRRSATAAMSTEQRKRTYPRQLLPVVLAALLGVSAVPRSTAQSPWPMLGHDRFHTYCTSVVGGTRPVLKWRTFVGGGLHEPSIGADGNIYAPSTFGGLAAVSPGGQVIWQRPYQGTPAVGENGNLYVVYGYGQYCLDPNGAELWGFDEGVGQGNATIAADGNVWFTTRKRSTDGEAVGPAYGWGGSVIEASNGDIYRDASHDSIAQLQALYLAWQHEQWVWELGWEDVIYPGGGFYSYAVAPNGNIIAVQDRDQVRAHGADGTLLWSRPLGGRGLAVRPDGTIYTDVNWGAALCALWQDGLLRWVVNLGGSGDPLLQIVVDGAGTAYPVVGQEVIAVGAGGNIRWRLRCPPAWDRWFTPPVFGADGTMYVGASDGYLYAYVFRGDMNCDGAVNAFDIDPFVLALISGPSYEAYYAQFPNCDHLNADINADGAVNAFDIDPFVELLSGE
jgi:hypothetical protein